MPRLPIPADTDAFTDETRGAICHIIETRGSTPPPSSYMTYAGKAGMLLSDLVEHLRHNTSLTDAETELAICQAARAANADFIWDAHVRLGLKAGVREMAIHAMHSDVKMDRRHMNCFVKFLGIIRLDNFSLGVQQVALTVLLENGTEIPAMAMIVSELGIF